MMKNLLAIMVFAITLLSCKEEPKSVLSEKQSLQKENPVLHFKQNLIKSAVDSIFKKYDFNANVGIFQDNQVLYTRNNGFKEFKNKTPLNDSTVFAIASISKQFTSVMIMKLEEDQKLKSTDSVFHYIPEFKNGGFKNIIISQLMNHTSGVVDEGNGLASKPGEKFHYSNKGYYYLGQIIEKASGKSFDNYALDFFNSIGLKHTFTSSSYQGHNFASAHVGTLKNNEETPGMPKRLANKNISNPAGGILSTVADLHLWNQKLYGGEIISKTSLDKVLKQSTERNHPIFGKMGYGYGLMMGFSTPKNYFHSGYIKGAPSLNIYYPETKTSVIILSNIANESIGKTAFFKPHKEIKHFTDLIEIASEETSL